ncbi:MAG: type III secretion protein [Kiritimatiellae bacterium]|nr:type III secretion protein [Kiritimatiellia bacterium]
MAYALQSMLKIRAMREDRTQSELAQARSAKSLAEKALEEREEAIIEYESTKDERRDKVYQMVIGKVVSMDDLDRVRAAVSQIDEEGMLLWEAEKRAKVVVEEKDKAVETARLRYVEAVKEKTKFVEHRRVWEAEEHLKEELAADREMEDFVGVKLKVED